MDATVVGCAAAASSIGYHHLAEIILQEQMPPSRIARLFSMSASKQAGHDTALIILAGGISRYRAEPAGWCGDVERALAREALAREPRTSGGVPPKFLRKVDLDQLLTEISGEAARLVKGCSKREELPAVA
jgi:hypothetical protein